MYTDTRLRRND